MPLLRLEEATGGRGVGQPAAHEHLREDVRDAEIAAQALGGGEVVGGDVEAGVLSRHGPDARAGSGRKGRPVADRALTRCARVAEAPTSLTWSPDEDGF